MLKQARATAISHARGMRLSPADADDVAQQALVKLLAQDPLPDNPDAWITTVTHRLAIDLRRAQGRAPEPGLGADDVQPDERQALAEFIRRGVPVSDVVDRDAIDRIWQQLRAQLSERELEILTLTAEGVEQSEIAERLGYKNPDSVKATLNRIRRKVEADLEEFRLDRGHPRLYDERRQAVERP